MGVKAEVRAFLAFYQDYCESRVPGQFPQYAIMLRKRQWAD